MLGTSAAARNREVERKRCYLRYCGGQRNSEETQSIRQAYSSRLLCPRAKDYQEHVIRDRIGQFIKTGQRIVSGTHD